jgi:hypothetical protein
VLLGPARWPPILRTRSHTFDSAGKAARSVRSAGAKISADGLIIAPHLAELGKDILSEMGAMLHAAEIGSPAEGRQAAERLARTKVQGRLYTLGVRTTS